MPKASYYKTQKEKAVSVESLVQSTPDLLKTLPRQQQTTKVCLAAAKVDYRVIADIKSPWIKARVSNIIMGRGVTMQQHARRMKIEKYNRDLEMVRQDGEHLIDVPPEEHTEELCLTAVLNDRKAYYFIKSPLIRDFCNNAMRNPYLTAESFEEAKARKVGYFRPMQRGPR